MLKSHSADRADCRASDVIIPLIRTAATIGFAIAPYSLGFVIVAVSDKLIHSIMVGDVPELLVSDLQNRFPDCALEVADTTPELVAQVVEMIEHPASPSPLHTLRNGFEARC